MLITLSPDENPGDAGATRNGEAERTFNIMVANYLMTALRRCGQVVHFDPTQTFVERVALANSDGTQVLVACAHNWASDPAAEGAVFVFCPGGHGFGAQDAAAANVGAELVGAGIVRRWGTYDEQVYECCQFRGDTVYIEFAFMSNDADWATIHKPSYPHDAAEAACRGLARTYGFTYVPESSGITWVTFSATCKHTPLWFYGGPHLTSPRLYQSAATSGTVLQFDGWQYGDAVIDPATNAPDRRWFHRIGPGYGWAPSAWFNGNPPSSSP